jgi:hypothetical protein
MRAADDDTPRLPDDPAALRALLLDTLAQIDTLAAERDALALQNERLQHLLLKLKLKRRQFGQKSEQLLEYQLLFAFEEIEATLAGNAAEGAKTSPALRISRESAAGLAAAGCRRTCRASRWYWRPRRPPAPAAAAR